jgi:hypothetical protein
VTPTVFECGERSVDDLRGGVQIEKTSLVTLKGMEVLNLNITKAFFDTMDSTIETWKEDMRNATVKDMEVVCKHTAFFFNVCHSAYSRHRVIPG